MVSLRNFELFLVDRILIFGVNPVLVVLGQPQVVFVQADSILVLEKLVQELLLELLWYLEVASS